HGERYHTITGKDYRPRRMDLGRWRYLAGAVALVLVFLIAGVPFLMMLYASLLPFYQAPSLAAFESMSFANYWNLFHNTKTIAPMINSTILGPTVATTVVLIVALIAYFVHKTEIRGRKILDVLGFAPIAIPSVVLGATFFWFYLLVRLPVIGTLTIIGLAYLTKYMPVALRFVSASMMQVHNELDEAAQVAGVSWGRNFLKVTLPLLRPGLLAAWFWVMVHAYRELTVALMLARSQNRTAAVVIYDLWEEGSFLLLSAFGVLMFLLLMALLELAYLIGRRFGVQEQYYVAIESIVRHARPCAGHPRLPCTKQGVDGGDKLGHDGGRGCCAMIRVEGLTKTFTANKEVVTAVAGIDFEGGAGEMGTLLGPSGCATTTKLRCIAGREKADGGRIVIGDRPVVDVAAGVFVPPHRRNLGMVFQSYAIWPHMTVFENVVYALEGQRMKRAERKRL